jgi:hypothetical protein
MIPPYPRNKGANWEGEVKALNELKIICYIKWIAVLLDELSAASDRDAAEFQTPNCTKNPERGVMVGRGTALLTISFSVVIIKRYVVINFKSFMILWTSSEMVGDVD